MARFVGKRAQQQEDRRTGARGRKALVAGDVIDASQFVPAPLVVVRG